MQKPIKPTHAATDQRSGQCSQHPSRGLRNADRTGVPGIGGIHALLSGKTAARPSVSGHKARPALYPV